MSTPTRLTCLLILTLAPAAGLAENVVVSGRLITDTGRPIVGYPVIVEGDAGQFVAITDAEGGYQLGDLPGGSYTAAPAGDLTAKEAFTVEQAGTKGIWDMLLPGRDDAAVAPTLVPTIRLQTQP